MLTGPLPQQVDHRKLAEEKTELHGSLPLASFTRLGEMIATTDGDVEVQLKFRPGKKQRTLVLGKYSATVVMECQNCLEPVTVKVESSLRSQIVAHVEDLLAMEQEEDGIVCNSRELSLVDLLEDELIVNLPMVPRHEAGECTGDQARMSGEDAGGDESVQAPEGDTYRPFAGLAKLTEDLKRS